MPVMARPRKSDAGKPKRTGLPLHVYLDARLRTAFEEYTEETRRTLTEEVSIALENHLKAAGRWPIPAQS